MQTFSARKFSLRTPRFNSETGKRRNFWYSWRALAAGLALAVIAGSGIAVAATTGNAEAHTPKLDPTCYGLTVSADSYNDSKGEINTVVVTIDGNVQDTVYFGSKTSKSYTFADASVSHSYSAKVTAWDDPDGTNEWTQSFSTTQSTPCPSPTVTVKIPACTVASGTVDFVASLGNLDPSHSYSIALSSSEAGATNIAATGFTPGSTPSYDYPFTRIVPGHGYTVTIVDKTANLSAHADAPSIGCPQDTGIKITATECQVDGGTGTVTANVSGLSVGRGYTITVYDLNGIAISAPAHLKGDASGIASVPIGVPAGGTYKATIVDDAAPTKTNTSETYSFLPCPKELPKPKLVVDPCTATSGTSNAVLSYAATGLVPGRAYIITVTTGAGAAVIVPLEFTAASNSWPTDGSLLEIKNIASGSYKITVTDKLLPVFTQFLEDTIIQCPTLPVLAFTPSECSVPGGSSALTATITDFIPTRDYIVGVTQVQGGAVVVAAASFTAPAVGVPFIVNFPTLPPGTQYRVTVTDSVVSSVSGFGDISLKVCPGVPTVVLQVTCNLLGASSVNVSLDKLEPTETYTVNIVNASNKSYGTTTVVGADPTVNLKLPNIPNGNSYVVNVANATSSLTGSASIFLKKCDLPTLAFTGANPVGPAVAGIGFLQLGLMFLGLSLVVRRRRTA